MTPTIETTNAAMCRKAMIADRPLTIRFTYRDAKGNESVREAEPYKIKDGKVFGFCLEKLQIRQFDLEKMSRVSLGSEFVPRNGWPIETDL